LLTPALGDLRVTKWKESRFLNDYRGKLTLYMPEINVYYLLM
jgi:hypothetical protein